MGARWLGYGRIREQPKVGDLVICLDSVRKDENGHTRRFLALVLDKSISVYKLQLINDGRVIYWPESATYLWRSK